MPKTIRAKFRVDAVSEWKYSGADGKEEKTGEQIQMSPVFSDDPASENYDYSQATPSGAIELGITNPGAFGFFAKGQEYCIEFAAAGQADNQGE